VGAQIGRLFESSLVKQRNLHALAVQNFAHHFFASEACHPAVSEASVFILQVMTNLVIRCSIALFALLVVFPAKSVLAEPLHLQLSSMASPAEPQRVETWIEEWDPLARCWARIDRPSANCPLPPPRLAQQTTSGRLAQYGPFLVLNERSAALIDTTDSGSLDQFERMIAAFPYLDQLNFINAPGTVDDLTNLKLGRRIRGTGLSTHVPANGSARSGAVDLFLAGVRRTMAKGARFAVHSWRDNLGQGPADFPEYHPVNVMYLEYYMDMGMSHKRAREFYRMTNSVTNPNALWFGPEEMHLWLTDPAMAELRGIRERALPE
jgi:hypothetical protein